MPISLNSCNGLIPTDRRISLFLDVDGVLLEIAETPDGVYLPPDLMPILGRLIRACDGAVALVSGRSLAFLESMFEGLPIAMAGLHGVERRMPDGRREMLETSEAQLADLRVALSEFAIQNPGVSLEDKGVAIALHYRSTPSVGSLIAAFLDDTLPRLAPDFHVQPGKMVYEVKPRGMDKGAAIDLLLGFEPFSGRIPIFAGDDITDEHGFAVVNARDGISIKVGEGQDTLAKYHIGSVSELRTWLSELADHHQNLH